MSGRDEVYEEYKAGRRERSPTCSPSSGRTCTRWSESFGYENVKVPGYEADDVIATLAGQARGGGHRRDGGDRRPRPVPADRAGRADHGHRPRDHRHEDLRPRGRGRPLRDPARADPRLRRAQGRHLGQHPGRARASATRPPRSCSRSGATSRACWPTSTRSRAPSASRTSPSTPRTRASRSSSRPPCATSRWRSTSTRWSRASRTARACARRSASSSCAPRWSASRRRSARTAPRPPSGWTRWSRCAAREVPLAELGSLEGELVAVAALRPGRGPRRGRGRRRPRIPTRSSRPRRRPPLEAVEEEVPVAAAGRGRRPGAGLVRLRRRPARAAHGRRLGGRRGARGRGRDAGGVRDGARRAARSWRTTGRRSRWPTSPATRRRWRTTRWSRPT